MSYKLKTGIPPLRATQQKLWARRSMAGVFLNVATMLILMLCTSFFFSCNSDSAPDCFQSAGDVKRDVVEVSVFDKITVFENVRLVLKDGAQQKVEIETGEFLRNEVTAIVEGDRLLLRNTNDCNYVRDYGMTTVYITSPKINEIRSSTGLPIQSDGVLNYDDLTLFSESFINDESETTDGEFDLELNAEDVKIVVNGITYFKLNGTAMNLSILIAAGDSRIEAENLVAESVTINHRGTNDIYISPQQSLTGLIRGTGDVISNNRPPEVEVEELFNGRLIFRE